MASEKNKQIYKRKLCVYVPSGRWSKTRVEPQQNEKEI